MQRFKDIIFYIFFASLPLCIFASISCSSRALLDQAQSAWDNKDYEGATKFYEEFLNKESLSDRGAEARFRVAAIYQRDLRQFDKAIRHYIYLLQDFPKNEHAYQARVRLAECYAIVGKRREAVSEYESVLAFTQDAKEKRKIRLSIAEQYDSMKDLGQAVAEYKKVTNDSGYDDLSERALINIAGIRALRNEYDDAAPAYKTIISNTKDAAIRRMAYLGLADCYLRMSQFDIAVETLKNTPPDPRYPDDINKRIEIVRDQQRQRNMTVSSSPFRRAK